MEEGMDYYDPQEEEEYFMDTIEGEGTPDKETEMIVPGIRSKDEADELFAEEVKIAEIEEIMNNSENKYQQQQQQHQQQEPQEPEEEDKPDTSTPVNTATFGYRLEGSSHCSWPGPIMRLQRGEKHGLFLKGNNNVATNLHFHGLHTTSKGAGDWLYRSVQGEENLLVYELDLKNKPHMGGTHWYHSHLHGASWDHVKGGAFGMIVVEDNGHEVGTNEPNVLAFLNEKQHEKTLVFDDSQNNQQFFANGLAEETLELVKDSWYRLRMLMVGIGSHRSEIKVEFEPQDDCEIHTLANDGIFRFQVPNPVHQTEFVLSPSSRVDVAIRCSGTANILVDTDVVAKIITTDTSTTPPLAGTPFEDGGAASWPSARLDYTRQLLDLAASEVSTMKIRVDETSINGVNEARHKPLCNDDGKDFAYGSVQEWKLEGTATHPFHVHIHPLQVVSHGCGPHHEVGEYYDTIIAPDASLRNPCIVRVSLVDIDGPTTVHCHLFEHAEHGALTWFNVVKEEDDDTTNDVPTCIGTCNEPEQPPPKCSE